MVEAFCGLPFLSLEECVAIIEEDVVVLPINEAVAIVVGLGSDDVIGLDDISKEFFPFEAMGLGDGLPSR